jgi:cell division protein YceG involved in septum cleavage
VRCLFDFLTVSILFFSCTHVSILTTAPSNSVETAALGELEALHRQGLTHIERGEIKAGVHLLVSALAKASLISSIDTPRIAERCRLIESTLVRVERRMSVSPGNGWIEKEPGRFVPVSGDTPNPSEPSFHLWYNHFDECVALPGISYTMKFIRGVGRIATGNKTGERGQGACHVLTVDEDRESSSGAVIELVFRYNVAGYTHEFDLPKAHFHYPTQRVFVEIKRGERVKDLLDRLIEKGLTTHEAFLFVAANGSYPECIWVPPPKVYINRFEGLFVPGYYSFPKSQIETLSADAPMCSAEEPEASKKQELAIANAGIIVRRLIEESAQRFAELPQANGLKGYEQIILASIVEKEAVANHDYEKVASVFYNRLKRGSQLASCPSVEYAIGYHRPFLKREDVLIDSPYNLYIREGLPPTPICFFSEDALKAVREPLDSGLLYFVYDWTVGRLYFASAYQEHLANSRRARENYIEKHGASALHRICYDKYYEE